MSDRSIQRKQGKKQHPPGLDPALKVTLQAHVEAGTPELLTRTQAAQILGMHANTFDKVVNAGKITRIYPFATKRSNGHPRYTLTDVLTFAQTMRLDAANARAETRDTIIGWQDGALGWRETVLAAAGGAA